jgi:hypothetical protein
MIISQLIEVLFVSFVSSTILIIWFNTNAFYEYCKYFRIFGFLVYGYEEKLKKSYSSVTFVDYLLADYNSFFIRLICCSICVNMWLNFLINLMFFSLQNVFFTFILSLFVYYHLTIQKNKLENDS